MRQLNQSEIDQRISTLQNQMANTDFDGAPIVQNADMYYFSGAIVQGYIFVPVNGSPIHFVMKGMSRVKEDSFIKNIISISSPREIISILNDFEYRLNVIGLELDVLPYNLYSRFSKLLRNSTIKDIGPLIRSIRMIKSPYEVDQIKKAGQLSTLVFEEARNNIKEGASAPELVVHIEHFSRQNGSSGIMRTRGFNQELGFTLLGVGPDASIPSYSDGPMGGRGYLEGYPHGVSNVKFKKAVPIILDYEGIINGYKSDMTRTFSIGSLSKEMEEAYEITYEINEFMKSNLKPGAICSDLYKSVYDIVNQSKYKDHFMGFEKAVPFIGHGVGLEVDELPVIFGRSQEEIQKNMIIAVEPKFLFEGGAVGIENTFQVTSDKPFTITEFDENIIRI